MAKTSIITNWLYDKISLKEAIKNSTLLQNIIKELYNNQTKGVRHIGAILKCRRIISTVLNKLYNEGYLEVTVMKRNKKVYKLKDDKLLNLFNKPYLDEFTGRDNTGNQPSLNENTGNNGDSTGSDNDRASLIENTSEDSENSYRDSASNSFLSGNNSDSSGIEKTNGDSTGIFFDDRAKNEVLEKLIKELELMNITDLEKLRAVFYDLIFSDNRVYESLELKRFAWSVINEYMDRFIRSNKNRVLTFMFQLVFWLVRDVYRERKRNVSNSRKESYF